MASVVASTVSVMPIVSWMIKKYGFQSFSILRSFENPAVGIAFRLAFWGSIVSMGADDDDSDSALEEIIGDFSFIFLPVLIGMLGRDVYKGVEWWGE